MSARKFDYILVGFGLAGSALAMHLHWLNKRVLIINDEKSNISSEVAAGLYNPVTGRKMVKTWMADRLFPYLENYYQKIENLTEESFLIKNNIYRPFATIEEQNEWMGRSSEPTYKQYIHKIHQKSTDSEVNDSYGGVELTYSGYLNVSNYLKACRDYLISEGHSYCNERFKYDKVQVLTGEVKYEGDYADRIIFCEGPGVVQNPYFDWLPMRPVKGEIVFIKSKPSFNYILNRGVFVIDTGKGYYKVGSNYDNYDLTTKPTQKAKDQILNKLEEIYKGSYTVIDQIAGIRPATKDRRPILGWHPKFETIGVFNGLGTKGVSLAPYFAKQFADQIVKDSELLEAININRYFSLYSDVE